MASSFEAHEQAAYHREQVDEPGFAAPAGNCWACARTAGERVHDLRKQMNKLILQEFVNNDDVALRRSIIASLELRPLRYPLSSRPLVKEAIRIARNHPDSHIRHRMEVQLGNETLMRPIPSGGQRPNVLGRIASWFRRES